MAVNGVMHMQQRQRELTANATVIVEVVSPLHDRLMFRAGMLLMHLGAWVAGFAGLQVVENKS